MSSLVDAASRGAIGVSLTEGEQAQLQAALLVEGWLEHEAVGRVERTIARLEKLTGPP
ncbi:MAG: hypothetical protein ACR2GL_05660 [Thermoleophilaceae bacterium]